MPSRMPYIRSEVAKIAARALLTRADRICLQAGSHRMLHIHSPIDIEALSGDVIAFHDEVPDQGGNVFRLAEAPHGHASDELVSDLVGEAGDKLGLDKARAYRVHRDIVAHQLDGRGLGQADDAGLRCCVVGDAYAGRLPLNGADVDDTASVPVDKVRGRSAKAVEGAVQVGAHHRCPLLCRHPAEGAVPADPGVVHEHVQTAQLLDGGLHQLLDLLMVRNVCLDLQRPYAAFGDGLYHLVGGRFVLAVIDHHRSALLPQLQGNGAAYAPGCARDQRYLILQIVHAGLTSLTFHTASLLSYDDT